MSIKIGNYNKATSVLNCNKNTKLMPTYLSGQTEVLQLRKSRISASTVSLSLSVVHGSVVFFEDFEYTRSLMKEIKAEDPEGGSSSYII